MLRSFWDFHICNRYTEAIMKKNNNKKTKQFLILKLFSKEGNCPLATLTAFNSHLFSSCVVKI